MKSLTCVLAFAALLSAASSSLADAAQALASCYYPNTRIAGARTPNPHHYPIVANKSLPFGTLVRFTNHHRSAIFIVKDRGPYIRGRSYDLDCHAARREIGFDGLQWLQATILRRRHVVARRHAPASVPVVIVTEIDQ